MKQKNKERILTVLSILSIILIAFIVIGYSAKIVTLENERDKWKEEWSNLYDSTEKLKDYKITLFSLVDKGGYYTDIENRLMYRFWIDQNFNFKGETVNLTVENFKFTDDFNYSVLFRFGSTWEWIDIHLTGKDKLTDWYFLFS